ncbi:acid phosphatase domain-containing protein [Hirsutella rhossiliensis]|uniref:Acid phosphatase domain-containing protein n=1 Tax=Hirsutella rhossiliensis TaxID=111463 RepID=A0A9P8MXR3_9HYPO|nr:acid phosphatase domain-containing protein [Hirsutella rhossiliensis]KAH0961092.1 acid phosphatase domain-containing protein [Hirsutella rhossiliensis]
MTDQRRPVATRDILWLTINNITVVNFYRQPHYDEALEMLLQWTTPGSLLNPADVPTNPHGNTIDLAFSNIPLSEAVVEEHLATSSDHFTLSVTLADLAPASVPLGKVRLTSDDELARFAEMVDSGATAIPAAASSPQELDSLALALVELLQLAAKAAGRPVRKGARSAPWWTEECALAAAEYRAIRRVYPLGFNREVQLARETSRKSASIFKAVRWLRSPGAFQPPPLQVGDVVYETQLDKANALRRATLERRTADDDIPDPWIPVDTTKTVPFTQQASLEEVRDATLRTGNTSPGPDSITVQMLKARSAVDLVAALLHDIEEAFARGQVATLILRLRKPKGRFGYADDTGIWLDSTLSFKTHVEKWTAKAQVVAYHLKSLANTKHGPLPGAVRRAQAANLLLAASATIRRCLCKPPRKTSQQRISAFGSAKGALEGLRAALSLPRSQRVVVCLDNIAAATCLRGMPADSSQDVFLEFQALATAHAKAGTSQPEPAGAVPTLAYLRRAARQQPKVHLKPAVNRAIGRDFDRPILVVFAVLIVIVVNIPPPPLAFLSLIVMPRKPSRQASASTTTTPSNFSLPASLSESSLPLPKLIVFDLDYTLWPFWVDTHVTPPIKPNAHHSAASDRLGEHLAFYDDVPSILQALNQAARPDGGIQLGVASRTSAPDLARQLLQMLHLPALPGTAAADDEQVSEKPRRRRALDVFDGGLEIYPGSKLRHFEALRRRTGIPYEDMLFFDDESRNRETEQLGITMRLVRDGVTWSEVERGVDEWRRRRGYGGGQGKTT